MIEPSSEASKTVGRAKSMVRVSETMGDEMGALSHGVHVTGGDSDAMPLSSRSERRRGGGRAVVVASSHKAGDRVCR